MKKIITLLLTIGFIFSLQACQNQDEVLLPYTMIFGYMGTETQITIFIPDVEKGPLHREEVDRIYGKYHELSDYYRPLPEESPYLENIYTINQKPNQDLEIDEALYNMLVKAEEYREMTNGYFDISIGDIVAVWKDLTENYRFIEISNTSFQQALLALEDLEVIEEGIELWTQNNKFYIRIKEGVVLDTGAITKGYSTEIVKDYFESQGIEYYAISGGSSSISLGLNYNRETRLFHIGLLNPVRLTDNDRSYGLIYVKNTGVTTSGNFVQYAVFEELRYHHIVSPFTKAPVHYYHSVTVVGEDLGLMDVISTALFNMDPETFEAWLDVNQDALDIEVIRFNYDRSVTKFLRDTVFEER